MPKFSSMRRPASVLAGLAVVLVQTALADPLYPSPSKARADIDAACAQAASSKKLVLVEFGANWCTDCKVLDANFHRPENQALLASRFVLVHVNVGDDKIDHNLELAQAYGIPLSKGVPALAVLDSAGHVIYSQKNGEFEAMRRMDPQSVNDFLKRWSQ